MEYSSSSSMRNDDEYHDFSQLFSEPHDNRHTTKLAVLFAILGIAVIHYKVPLTAWMYSHVFEPTWSLLETLRFYVLPMDEDEYEAHEFGISQTTFNKQLPELQEMSTSSTTTTTLNISSEHNHAVVEPAFLRQQDYPPGWMVYDSELGVILKTRADTLQKERAMKQNEECRQQNAQDEVSSIPAVTPSIDAAPSESKQSLSNDTTKEDQSLKEDETREHSKSHHETTLCRTTKLNAPTDASTNPVVEAT